MICICDCDDTSCRCGGTCERDSNGGMIVRKIHKWLQRYADDPGRMVYAHDEVRQKIICSLCAPAWLAKGWTEVRKPTEEKG